MDAAIPLALDGGLRQSGTGHHIHFLKNRRHPACDKLLLKKPGRKENEDMKATGIVNRVDDLGRIVIPREIRRTLGVTDGTPMELFAEGKKLIIQKYIPEMDFKNSVDDLRKVFYETEEFFDAETANKIEEHIKALTEILKESEE